MKWIQSGHHPLPECLTVLMNLHPFTVPNKGSRLVSVNNEDDQDDSSDNNEDDEENWVDPNIETSILPQYLNTVVDIKTNKKERIEVAPTFRLYFVDTRPLPVISSSSPSGNQSTKLLQLTTPPTGL